MGKEGGAGPIGQSSYPQVGEEKWARTPETTGNDQQLDDDQPLEMPITLTRWEAMKPAEGLVTQPPPTPTPRQPAPAGSCTGCSHMVALVVPALPIASIPQAL